MQLKGPCLLQTINTMMLLETPYPKDRVVALVNSTSQMVDDNLRPVPLSEVRVCPLARQLVACACRFAPVQSV